MFTNAQYSEILCVTLSVLYTSLIIEKIMAISSLLHSHLFWMSSHNHTMVMWWHSKQTAAKETTTSCYNYLIFVESSRLNSSYVRNNYNYLHWQFLALSVKIEEELRISSCT